MLSEVVWKWLEYLPELGLDGFNVTIPYKRSVFDWVIGAGQGQLGRPEEVWIGAVNTIEIRDGRPIGWNTDAAGFSDVFKRDNVRERLPSGFGLEKKKAVLLGAGGSARAVAFDLIWSNEIGELVVWNRHRERAEVMANDMRKLCQEGRTCSIRVVDRIGPSDMGDAALLVNTVPISDSLCIDPDLVRAGMIVYDLVYTPPWTMLLRTARKRRAIVISGLEMLASQAALSFHMWLRDDSQGTQVRPLMIEALKERTADQWPS